jgi:hypothetical protein
MNGLFEMYLDEEEFNLEERERELFVEFLSTTHDWSGEWWCG